MPLSIRTRLFTAALATPLLALPVPADAAESYDNCAWTITSLPVQLATQGVWCLKSDLATSITTGAAIEIVANNVTLDCNGFKIGGLAAGKGTQTWGVLANVTLNTTVRNCNIRGFYYGVVTWAGGGHVVEDNRLDGNTAIGIYSNADGNLIRGNQVIDTGGSTVTSSAHGIYVLGLARVIDNIVSGVTASGASDANGIFTNAPGSFLRNDVSGVGSETGGEYGIRLSGNYGLIDDNYIHSYGGITYAGIYCSNSSTTARNNVIAETVTGVSNCLSVGNVVQP